MKRLLLAAIAALAVTGPVSAQAVSVPKLDPEALARVQAYSDKTVAELTEIRRSIWSKFQGEEAKTKVREAWAARLEKANHEFAHCMIEVGAYRDPRTTNECWALSEVTDAVLEAVSWREQP
jgi:hypothetical protein